MNPFEQFHKYRWFYTSSKKLVIGGKNAEQNDFLLANLLSLDRELLVMHTLAPGSPFTVINESISQITEKEKKECAVFTACFSKAWKQGNIKTKVESFTTENIFKDKIMKIGTWGVLKRDKEYEVKLELALTFQKGILRAVPPQTLKNKKEIILLKPGKVPKDKKVFLLLKNKAFKKEELFSALPSGGYS